MSETDTSKDEHNSKLPPDLGSEYSYLDFLIERKFYKRFWRILWVLVTVISIIGGLLAFLGFGTYADLRDNLEEAQTANERLQQVYSEYLREDSLKVIRDENSQYYAYFLQHDDVFIRDAIQKKIDLAGFSFANSAVELALSNYLYKNGRYYGNIAKTWINEQRQIDSFHVAIGVLHRGVPNNILNRADSIFISVYPDALIKHFEDTELPDGGFLYHIR